jgi:hypothetical protein
MARQWVTREEVAKRNQLGDAVASLSHKDAPKITVTIGDATDGTPHQWKSRKAARKWAEALVNVPVWREGAYYDYLYEGVALKPHIRPPLVPDDEVAFEGAWEPTDPSLDAATTFEVPTEASLSDLKSDTHVAVVDALGLTRDPPHSPNLTTLSEGALTCQESVYVGPEFYLCSKSEGHGGAHQDQPKNFRWGESRYFPLDDEPFDPQWQEKLGVQPHFEVPEALDPADVDWEEMAEFPKMLLAQGLPARCQSVCSVDGSQCIFPDIHTTEINEYPAWHESDTCRSWRIGLADITPQEHTDTLNEFLDFLDALEELGVPENIGITVAYKDSNYTWRGYYWSLTHEVDLLSADGLY